MAVNSPSVFCSADNHGWGKLKGFHCFWIEWHKSCCSETALQMLGCDTSLPQLLNEARKDLLGYVSRLDFELVVFQDGAPSLLHKSEYTHIKRLQHMSYVRR